MAHQHGNTKNCGEREIAAVFSSPWQERNPRLGKTPDRLFRVIHHPDAAIEPSDGRNQDKHERKPEQRIKGNGRCHAEASVMQCLVCTTRRLKHRPASRNKRKPNDGTRRPHVAAEREKEQRRNRQQGKVRRQAVLGYGLMHFSTSDACRPCRGSGRSRSCARGHRRRRTYESGTRPCHRAGGSG